MLIRTLGLLSLLCLGLVTGCGKAQPTHNHATVNETTDDHADPHDVPLTTAEIDQLRADTATWMAAVEHIEKYRDTIKTETTGGTPAKAHRALDLLDYVFEWLPEIARNSNVPKDRWQAIGENLQELRDAFSSVHANIDNGDAPGYELVAAEIDAAVEVLSAIKAGDDSNDTNAPE